MEGGCLCGAIRYQLDGQPRRITNCHCLHCRRSCGAPFVTWIELHPSDFKVVSGRPSQYESRPQVTRQFCGTCGTQLTYQHAEEPDTIDVTACSLDSVERIHPEDHIWTDRIVPWVTITDGRPRYKLRRADG
jgi:hypothetical protein